MSTTSTYTQTRAGVPNNSNPGELEATSSTKLILLDGPLFRDQDDGLGYYEAASGYSGLNWSGAIIYTSSDGGADYVQQDALTSPIVWGSSTTALGNFTGGNAFDEGNTLTVRILSGALYSTTILGVLNGNNTAMVGNELIQFRTVNINSDGSYTISGLLRGRRGTEWAMATHAIGEQFVQCSLSAMLRIATSTSLLNVPLTFKAITIGSTIASVQTFADTGQCLKPYSPVLFGVGRDVSLNATLTWVRRTRVGGAWSDNADVILGEATESYDIEIWDSTYTTLKRTFYAVTSATVNYTSAQQISDFGSTQSIIYVKVYQLSATIGRGYPLQGQG